MMPVIAAVLVLCASPSLAWWCNGHMTIAQVATTQLSADTLSFIESKLKVLSEEGPFPMTPDFTQVACWADDLKTFSLSSMDSWHFYNAPYSPDGTVPTPGVLQEENVASVIMQMDKAMKKQANDYVLAFALANIVHFYGDSHQPLHTIELFSREYPKGDRGGNEESVEVNGTWTKLHFVWDAVCWKFPASYERPLSVTDRRLIETYANYLVTQYKFSDAQVNTYNATEFVMEGYGDAIKYAYPMNGTIITSGAHITEAYLNKCLPIAEARLTLSGLRLGRQLQYLLQNASRFDDHTVARKVLDHIAMQHHSARRFATAHKRV